MTCFRSREGAAAAPNDPVLLRMAYRSSQHEPTRATMGDWPDAPALGVAARGAGAAAAAGAGRRWG